MIDLIMSWFFWGAEITAAGLATLAGAFAVIIAALLLISVVVIIGGLVSEGIKRLYYGPGYWGGC